MAVSLRPASSTAIQLLPSRMRINLSVCEIGITAEYVDFHLEVSLDTRGLHKRVADAVLIEDAQALGVGKAFSDSTAWADELYLLTNKGLSDQITVLDQMTRVVDFIRDFDDLVYVTDSFTPVFTKGLVDSVTITESYSRFIQKRLSDAFGLNESVRFQDGSSAGVHKRITNTVSISDAAATHLGKKQSDSVEFTDSGSLTCQDYADPSYFAEVYVGESRTF